MGKYPYQAICYFLFFSQGCSNGFSQSQIKIYNGDPVTDPNDFIYQVSVVINPLEDFYDGSVLCSGTIIAPGYILTAAHCLKHFFIKYPDKQAHDIYVGFGPNVNAQMEKIAVYKTFSHPQFSEETDGFCGAKNDIALLKLKSPVPMGFRPAPFCTTAPPVKYDQFHVAGYGNIHTDGRTSNKPHFLTSAVLTVSTLNPSGRSFATFYAPQGILRGDSGGGAFQTDPSGEMCLMGVSIWKQGKKLFDFMKSQPSYEFKGNFMILEKFLNWIQEIQSLNS